MSKTVRITTVITMHWKADCSVEVFINLGKLYKKYDAEKLSVSRFTLDKKDLYEGYENSLLSLKKIIIT